MRVRNPADDRETESAIAFPTLLRARTYKAFEDPLLILSGDPATLIAHPQIDLSILTDTADPAPERDRHALLRVGDGVGGQLEQRLGEPLGVDERIGVGSFIEAPLPVGEPGRFGEGLDDEFGEVGAAHTYEIRAFD